MWDLGRSLFGRDQGGRFSKSVISDSPIVGFGLTMVVCVVLHLLFLVHPWTSLGARVTATEWLRAHSILVFLCLGLYSVLRPHWRWWGFNVPYLSEVVFAVMMVLLR